MANETILVVEDNAANMVVAMALLKPAGYAILQATTAEEGIAIAKAETPDLILMDISLPGMDGLTATSLLKEDARTERIPVLALTAHAMKGDEEKAFAVGCAGYITKPIEKKLFLAEIARVVENSGRA